jgi:endogenous inhibitor of DNA gyrase (YacG/DUF329 family)
MAVSGNAQASRIRPCKRCGKMFRGRATKVYCSDRCRFADWADRRAKEFARLREFEAQQRKQGGAANATAHD